MCLYVLPVSKQRHLSNSEADLYQQYVPKTKTAVWKQHFISPNHVLFYVTYFPSNLWYTVPRSDFDWCPFFLNPISWQHVFQLLHKLLIRPWPQSPKLPEQTGGRCGYKSTAPRFSPCRWCGASMRCCLFLWVLGFFWSARSFLWRYDFRKKNSQQLVMNS